MKTQYSRRTSGLLPLAARLPAVIVVCILLVLLVFRIFFPSTLAMLAAPLWQVGTYFSGKAELSEGREAVEAERDRLRVENTGLAAENAMLRARLQDVGASSEIPNDEGVLAGVLARPPLSPYDTLILDRGSTEGVEVGAVVYAQSAPIGTIAEVGQGSSRALLYSSSGRATEGWIGEDRLPVTLRGEGAGAFSSDVPRDLAVVEGDVVYLPGPGALPIGTVMRVESHPSSPRTVLHIRPLVNPFALTFVRIQRTP